MLCVRRFDKGHKMLQRYSSHNESHGKQQWFQTEMLLFVPIYSTISPFNKINTIAVDDL